MPNRFNKIFRFFVLFSFFCPSCGPDFTVFWENYFDLTTLIWNWTNINEIFEIIDRVEVIVWSCLYYSICLPNVCMYIRAKQSNKFEWDLIEWPYADCKSYFVRRNNNIFYLLFKNKTMNFLVFRFQFFTLVVWLVLSSMIVVVN